MSVCHEFVDFLENQLKLADDGVQLATKIDHVGLHIMYKSRKKQIEEIIDKYYELHVDTSKKSGAV